MAEAECIYPIIEEYHIKYLHNELTGCDLAGIYVLCYLALRKPNGWSNGRLKEPIVDSTNYSSAIVRSLRVDQLSSSLQQLIPPSYFVKKLKITQAEAESFTIIDIFNTMQLSGIKHNTDHYINRTIVMWAVGQRPVRLLFHIPTPMEVLRQQASGERVVTMFTTIEELSTTHKAKLAYMRGMIDHSKDPLEFLVHDLKHMELFVDPSTHVEQVGFFKCMLGLNRGKPRSYFTSTSCGSSGPGFGYDNELWTELEYVISDM